MILARLLLLAAVAFPFGIAAVPDSPTSDEYAVYVNLLAERFAAPDTLPYVIRTETSDDANQLQGEFDGARLQAQWNIGGTQNIVPGADVVESFSRVRNAPAHVEARLLKVPARRIVSKAEIAFEFGPNHNGSHGAWEDFHARHGGGFLVFSRVGFNHDRTQALLSYSYYCGSRCAGGVYVLMNKVSGRWRIVSMHPTWAA
jgi:hypothetical protein